MRTGDIVLYRGDDGDEWYDVLIEDATHSPYCHVGVVVVHRRVEVSAPNFFSVRKGRDCAFRFVY